MYKTFCALIMLIAVGGCMRYHSPDRNTWGSILNGASMSDMTDTARVAKRPVYLGAGGKLITSDTHKNPAVEYGDKIANDNAIAVSYMARLEFALYDALRKPGISVQRAGTDVVVILVRDALMDINAPDISATGDDTLKTIARILRQYDATFIEIAGYTDATRDADGARRLSMDMASRVGVHMVQHRITPERIFIVGRGASRPIASQDDIGRLMNRRVEIRIAPAR